MVVLWGGWGGVRCGCVRACVCFIIFVVVVVAFVHLCIYRFMHDIVLYFIFR